MDCHSTFEAGGESYAKTFTQGDLRLPPAKKLIIVTCMDARVEPLRQLGFDLGQCHVIRNAGGMAKDSMRSIIISQRLLQTNEIAIFRHTDCGMVTFTTEGLCKIVRQQEPDNDLLHKTVDGIDFLEFKDLEKSVKEDIQFLKDTKSLVQGTVITGWIYDVKTGKSRRVV